MNNKQRSRWELTKADWIVYFLAAGICFFTMQQPDIVHTGGSSFALLKGHFFDFYEYNAEVFRGNNYMISTYIMFAIWNIPLELLKIIEVPSLDVPCGVILWYKLLPTCVFVFSAYIMFRLGQLMGLDKQRAKILSYLFLSTPIAFYSQFIFGQYDVFTVLFMLLAICFFYREVGKHNMIMFSIMFGMAGTFKYHALLFFVPLLLLKEKKLWNIVKNLMMAVLPIIVINLPYISSPKFQNGVGGFGALDYVFSASVEYFFGEIYLIPVLWIVVCVFAYMKGELINKKELIQWSIFICNLVVALIFGFTFWHPQWLMLATPFTVLAICVSDKKDIFSILDVALSIVFFVFVVNTWPDALDQHLFEWGVFGEAIGPRLDLAIKMTDLYPIRDTSFLFTCFAGILLARTLILYPKRNQIEVVTTAETDMNWFRGRFWISILFFLMPMFICFFSAIKSPVLSYSPESEAVAVVPTDKNEIIIEQFFVANTDTLSAIAIKIGTYERQNSSDLTIEIVDETKNVLASLDVDVENLVDNAMEVIEFAPIKVENGNLYTVRIIPSNSDSTNCVAIYRTADNTANEREYAVIDGVLQSYNLFISLYGE